jgi:trans-aconitate methyltransferase
MDKELDLYYQTTLPDRYRPTGWKGNHFQENAGIEEMYARINALDPTLVIDAGCGKNKHKPFIKNLIGFDASPYLGVDMCCAILDAEFEPASADAVLCLGSIQYIDEEYILANIDKVISWVKPGGLIEMRVMLNDTVSQEYHKVYDKDAVRYPWDDQLRNKITEKYNLEYVVEPWIYNATASIELLERKYRKFQRKQVDTGLKDKEWLESVKLKDSLMQELKRQCWTWRKSI